MEVRAFGKISQVQSMRYVHALHSNQLSIYRHPIIYPAVCIILNPLSQYAIVMIVRHHLYESHHRHRTQRTTQVYIPKRHLMLTQSAIANM